jgi:putative ABC transport system permease protein
MSLWRVAWRSIQQRSLASALTAFAMGLGVALVVAVLVIHSVVDQSFKRGSQGYDLIVGAKGSSLTLVLSTVFHLNFNQPLENIPYSYYERFSEGSFVRAVKVAVPVCVGHDYKGMPAIATTPDMFDRLTYMDDRKYEFSAGRNFDADKPYEAVVGATAARRLDMKIGDKFRPVASNPDPDGHAHEDEEFEIVGILAPTGTPNDRAIFMNIEGFFLCPAHQQGPSAMQQVLAAGAGAAAKKNEKPADEHAEHDHDHEHDDHDHADHEHPAKPADHEHADKDGDGHCDHEGCAHEHGEHDHSAHDHEHVRAVSAILVRTNDAAPHLAMTLPDVINREQVAQAVHPTRVIFQFFDSIVGNVQLMLLILAVLVVVVAGVGILVSIYNSMSDRRHEIAIMRALGASRLIVMGVILMESILLSLGGGLFGVLLGHGLIGILSPMIVEQTGVPVAMWDFQLIELILIPGLIVLATAVGFLPAAVAYRTDVAKSLAAGT